jgi:type IV secretory pathway VirB3-like protein
VDVPDSTSVAPRRGVTVVSNRTPFSKQASTAGAQRTVLVCCTSTSVILGIPTDILFILLLLFHLVALLRRHILLLLLVTSLLMHLLLVITIRHVVGVYRYLLVRHALGQRSTSSAARR